jgi:glyoxylate utilization-related uncharacterized protein
MATNNPARTWGRPSLFGKRRQRVELQPGDVQRIEGSGRVTIVCGNAWVTVNGTDMILRPGQSLYLPRGHQPVLISSLKHTSVIYEVR